MGQQLITKHLYALERGGLVSTSRGHSPNGPSRKEYTLRKSVSLTLDIAPNLFSVRLFDIDSPDATREISTLTSRIEKVLNTSSTPKDQESDGRINSLGRVISDVDERLADLEEERAGLLYIRNLAMSEASKLIKKSEASAETRRVLYHILDSHSRNVPEISESINLREEIVRRLLKEIEEDTGVT